MDMLAELVRTADPKLVVINYPHNPTGAAFTAVEVARIAGICEDVGAYLFGDEMYRWLEHPECDEDDDDEEENSEDDPPAPAAALYSPPSVCELYDRGITLGGTSKSLSMPGIRVGWLACPDRRHMGRLGELKDYTTLAPSRASEVLASIAIRNRSIIVNENLNELRENKRRLGDFCGRHPEELR